MVKISTNSINPIILNKADNAFTMSKSKQIIQNQIVLDYLEDFRPHRDGIQIIVKKPGLPNAQYALGSITDNIIRNNFFYSNGAMQPIFSSDGLIRNISIHDNHLVTKSAHCIALGGVLSASFANNTTQIGNEVLPAPIVLYPARIGGAVKNINGVYVSIWVVGFEADDYLPVKSDAQVHDRRHEVRLDRPNDIFIDRFRKDDFLAELTDIYSRPIVSTTQFVLDIRALALRSGRVL